jgi:signal transduction histidine kinase
MIALTSNGPAVIAPDVRRLEIRYTGIYLSDPDKVRFRYRLVPYDADWVEADDRRAAFYQELPSGDYRFDVTSALETAPWNGTVATLSFQVMPQWWQTGWFRFTSACLLLGIGWFAYAARVGFFRREQARHREFSRRLIDAQEHERKRIAGELHDSLGQNLTIVKNRLTLRQLDDETPDSDLDAISALISETIHDTRRISHNLRPYVLDRIGLTRAIEELARLTHESTGLQIETKVDNIDKVLMNENEINLYRVVQESLNNIVKHADASRVTVRVLRREAELQVRVEDDGRGFDPARRHDPQAPLGGMGLNGIEERVRIMGGSVRWISARREGTTMLATVPL